MTSNAARSRRDEHARTCAQRDHVMPDCVQCLQRKLRAARKVIFANHKTFKRYRRQQRILRDALDVYELEAAAS